MEYKLKDIASVIRSKNSGPYELTFDVIFKELEMYQKVKDAKSERAAMLKKIAKQFHQKSDSDEAPSA